MAQWYLSFDGKQVGPLEHTQAAARARAHHDGLAWREGMAKWLPISQVAELSLSAASSPPPLATTDRADDIEYKVIGQEMQFVEIELDPGESAVAEAGAMMYKDATVTMEAVFGDGTAKQQSGGFLDKLVGAGKRLVTGESLFMTVFSNTGNEKASAAFGAPYPGNIIPIKLTDVDGVLICQKDSFLCAAKGVSIGIHLQKKIMTGLLGGEGFVMQKLEGNGWCFIHAGGTIVERELGPGEIIHVDTGCIVAYTKNVDFEIEQAGNIKTAFFGGEGFFFAKLKGPGKIWLQSLPFSRLAGRMLSGAKAHRGEGSLLGGLGNLIDGDNTF